MRKLVIVSSALALAAAACSSTGTGDTESIPEPVVDEVVVGDGIIAQVPEPALITGGRVKVSMGEFAYDPAEITVQAGSTVTFAFTNDGAIVHEAVIGNEHAQEAHAKEMAAGMAMGEEGHGHGEEGHSHGEEGHSHGDEGKSHGEGSEAMAALRLDPGKSGKLTYTFETPGTYLIGCHEPGHYDAGMVATITVV